MVTFSGRPFHPLKWILLRNSLVITQPSVISLTKINADPEEKDHHYGDYGDLHIKGEGSQPFLSLQGGRSLLELHTASIRNQKYY